MSDVTPEDRCTLRTITVADYKDLKEDGVWRTAFECEGVDNWQGYSNAMKVYHEWLEQGEF